MTSSPSLERDAVIGAPPPFIRTGACTFMAQPSAEGPWSPGYCHGGAPAALVAHVLRDVVAPVPMQVARVTLNLMRPVPVCELEVVARVVKEGRKLQLLELEVTVADGTVVTRAEVLRIRRGDSRVAGCCPPTDLPGAEAGMRTRPPTGVGFSRLFDMRAVKGRFETPGPAAVWFGMHGDLVEGERTDAVTRVLACADFANGIGAGVSFADWVYPNADLTVYLAREPVSGWILVDADCWVGDEGRGVTHARLADERGCFGHSLQSTIMDRRVASAGP